MEDFVVDASFQGYVYLGHAEGQFEPQGGGGKRPYFNMYVFSPVSSYESDDYRAEGFKAEKKKCLSADVWKGFKPGDKVRLFFDDKQRVVHVVLDQ